MSDRASSSSGQGRVGSSSALTTNSQQASLFSLFFTLYNKTPRVNLIARTLSSYGIIDITSCLLLRHHSECEVYVIFPNLLFQHSLAASVFDISGGEGG